MSQKIPPYAVAVGVSAKVIRYTVSNTIIENLLSVNIWDKNIGSFSEKEFFKKKLNSISNSGLNLLLEEIYN